MYGALDVVTREDLVTFFSILISVGLAVIMVPYAERWRRRRSAGQDYQYGLHLLRALKTLQDDDGAAQTWSRLERAVTEQINSATDNPDYRPNDKAHNKQLREACANLEARGALRADARLGRHQSDEGYAWVAKQKWEITGIGKKALRRTLQRDSEDERFAIFELYYRTGDLPPPQQGEEQGSHHHEYLDRLLPRKGGRGDFIARADDKNAIGFLIRAGIKSQEGGSVGNSEFNTHTHTLATVFRYLEFGIEEPHDNIRPTAKKSIVDDAESVRKKVDIAWPLEGVIANRPNTQRVLNSIIKMSHPDFSSSAKDNPQYDLPALHYLAWDICKEDILRAWTGDPVGEMPFTVPNVLIKAQNFLMDYGDLFDEAPDDFQDCIDALGRSYPYEIVQDIEKTMGSKEVDDSERLNELLGYIRESGLGGIPLPEIPQSIRKSQIELEAWIAFLPE